MKVIEAELGSIVRIQSTYDDQSYMLVETKDADPFSHRISVESPLGKALLHKQKNEVVRVQGPRRRQTYFIKEVVPSGFYEHLHGLYLRTHDSQDD